MIFYNTAGQISLGSRLRRLADMITNDAYKIYDLYDIDIDPRWFPVFYMLSIKENARITELASDIGQTHAAVSQVVRDMLKSDIVSTHKCSKDGRASLVSLTDKGKSLTSKLGPQCEDVNTALEDIFLISNSNLWHELGALENELEKKSLYERVNHIRKRREAQLIQLVPYRPKYKKAFKALNMAWIEEHWQMESSDHDALNTPTENIINPGGYIAIALYKGKAVGTCALIRMDNHCFELAKMSVDDTLRGLGIGFMLGEHVIDQAKAMGATRIYLESNTVLTPAIKLYHKLGFKRAFGQKSPYARCNIQMELILNK